MKKEEVYIKLQGKSTEYCGKVYDILSTNGEKMYVSKRRMHIYSNSNEKYHFSDGYWNDGDVNKAENKQEVTIEQLKEILKPMETLEQQLQKAQLEVERLQKLIEEESKIKVGDVCKFWNDNKNSFVIGVVQHVCENTKLKYETIFDCQFPNAEKITNTELIKLLEQEIK